MSANQNYFWKQMPFVRLIIPLVAGIILQFYANIPLSYLIICLILSTILSGAFYFLKFSLKYTYRWVQGALIYCGLIACGALTIYQKDIKNNSRWIGHYKNDTMAVLATLQEPLVEKAKSYKTEATIESVLVNGEWHDANGRLLLYFGKDSVTKPALIYGSQVVFTKTLQEIKNSGNPGNFNYKQFNAFKDIYHQVFLKSKDYTIAKTTSINPFQQWLYSVRSFVISRLQQYIPGTKEAGVAEALLIGYRDDLDKDLVQAYSNTGVVHIIAISGLHLGMIYAVLVLLFQPFKRQRWAKWLKPVVILSVLWVFTFLAGAVPSILRSAVMFSFIILGETIDRKSSVYNTLASSAFVMLCYNPYFLWDIGFQLSYIAVVSIVAFSKPVYNWLDIQNKILDFFWKLTSVTIAAQILTLPVILYSFHQFPNLFLITNCIIVPLSTIVLFAELVVLLVVSIPAVATFCGIVTGLMLSGMNGFIEKMSSFSFAVTDQIQNSFAQTILLYIVIVCFAIWLMQKYKAALFAGLIALFSFFILDSVETYQVRARKKMIVYNVPKQAAVDFVSAEKYVFVGDNIMKEEGYLKNFHLKPARTLYKALDQQPLNDLFISYPFIQFHNSRIMLIDKPYKFYNEHKIALNAVIISKNPKVDIPELAKVFDCSQYIFDGSNSPYRIKKWKNDCDSLHIKYHIATDDGAFEMNVL